MSLIRICDYNGYEIAVNDETLLFACAALCAGIPCNGDSYFVRVEE